MRKSTITKTWLVSLGGVLGGLIVAGVGTALLFIYGGTAIWGGSGGHDIVGFTQGGFFWPAIGIIIAGGVVMAAGAIAQLVAWVMALVATAQDQVWVWFTMLLATGLLGFQLIGMIVYVVAGPERGQTALPAAAPAATPTLRTPLPS